MTERDRHKLKINSKQVITLEEPQEDSLQQQEKQLDCRFRDLNEGFEQLVLSKAQRDESIKQFMSNQIDQESKINGIMSPQLNFSQDAASKSKPSTHPIQSPENNQRVEIESIESSVMSMKQKLNQLVNQDDISI